MSRMFAQLFRVDSTLPPALPVNPKYSRDPSRKSSDETDVGPWATSSDGTSGNSSAMSSGGPALRHRTSLEDTVPSSSSLSSSTKRVIVHTVQPSDTIEGICITYGIKSDVLKRVNKLFSAGSLHMRRTISIPVEYCTVGDAGAHLQQAAHSSDDAGRPVFTMGKDGADTHLGESSSSGSLKRSSTTDATDARPRRRSATANTMAKDAERITSAEPSTSGTEDYAAALLSKVDRDIVSARNELKEAEATLPPPPQPRASRSTTLLARPSRDAEYVLPDVPSPSRSTTSISRVNGSLISSVSKVLHAVNPDNWKQDAAMRQQEQIHDDLFEL